MKTQPTPIELAKYLETYGPRSNINCTSIAAATELRRLYAENEALKIKQSKQNCNPVSGIVLRDGLPTLLQDKHIKNTDQRLYTSPQHYQSKQDAVNRVYKLLESVYLAGFNASSEGWNGEYPFRDNVKLPEQNGDWFEERGRCLDAFAESIYNIVNVITK